MKHLLSLFGEESRFDDMTQEQMQQNMRHWDVYTREAIDAGVHLGGEGSSRATRRPRCRSGRVGTTSSLTGRSPRRRSSSGATTCSTEGPRRGARVGEAHPDAGRHRRGPAGDGLRVRRLRGPLERGGRGGPAVAAPTEAVDRLFRQESGRAATALIRIMGDFELAEEAVRDAFLTALEVWPRRGVPSNPGTWIVTTARNRAIDRIRRARRLEDKVRELEVLVPQVHEDDEMPDSSIPDDRPAPETRGGAGLTARRAGVSAGTLRRVAPAG